MADKIRTIEIHETSYEIHPNEREAGSVVEVHGTTYDIFEDAGEFRFFRVDADGIAHFNIGGFNSEESAVEFAELCERMILVGVSTDPPSLTKIEECLQYLKDTYFRKS